MRSEEVELGMRVVVRSSYRQFGEQVGEVTATFGHPSYLALELLLDDGRSELFWARDVRPYSAGVEEVYAAAGEGGVSTM